MTQVYEHTARRGQRLRLAAWTGAAICLLVPLIAMRFTDEVAWSAADFALAAILLFGSLGAFEWVVRSTGNPACRAGVALTLAGVLLLVWSNAAVGIVGSEDNPVNAWFFAIPAVGALVAAAGRLRPAVMPRALFAMIVAQWLVAVPALADPSGIAREIVVFTIAFTMIWLAAAVLFVNAARARATP